MKIEFEYLEFITIHPREYSYQPIIYTFRRKPRKLTNLLKFPELLYCIFAFINRIKMINII